MITPDGAALAILLSPGTEAERQAKLTALHQYVLDPACPECGKRGAEDNDKIGYDLSYCCTACGTQWDAYPEPV